MPTLDLRPQYLRLLLDLFSQYAPETEVWAYGSRVNGQAHEGSDLDLVVRNPGHLDQPQGQLSAVRDALTESNLPLLVEILDWARMPEEFRREVQREHVLVVAPGTTLLVSKP